MTDHSARSSFAVNLKHRKGWRILMTAFLFNLFENSGDYVGNLLSILALGTSLSSWPYWCQQSGM